MKEEIRSKMLIFSGSENPVPDEQGPIGLCTILSGPEKEEFNLCTLPVSEEYDTAW